MLDQSQDPEGSESIAISEPITPSQRKMLDQLARARVDSMLKYLPRANVPVNDPTWEIRAYRNRCFLEAYVALTLDGDTFRLGLPTSTYDDEWVDLLRGIIHVPGLRGNPERAYQRSAVGHTYPGTFETYVASILLEWGTKEDPKLGQLAADLERLGLTWKVIARRVNDASIEVLVGRMPHSQQGGAWDLVSVADVGFGVSQTLPVLVALLSAGPGQIVYLEQPEIHLHPKAQLAMAECIVRASRRGVYVVVETHSSLLIRGLQTAVAKKEIPVEKVSMNWFSRDSEDGSQRITTAELDGLGRFGDWPVDFDDIGREADWAYLDAVAAVDE